LDLLTSNLSGDSRDLLSIVKGDERGQAHDLEFHAELPCLGRDDLGDLHAALKLLIEISDEWVQLDAGYAARTPEVQEHWHGGVQDGVEVITRDLPKFGHDSPL
jgi:hypothetical protein